MIIDGHRHIACDPAHIVRDMDKLGINRTVLVGVGVRDLDVVTVHDSFIFRSDLLLRTLGVWQSRRLVRSQALREGLLRQPRNDFTLQAIKSYPDRFYGFCFVNAGSPSAEEEAIRCLDAGMCGIKLALLQYPVDLNGPRIERLCVLAGERGVPIFFHQGLTPASSDARALVRLHPRVRFIIAHAGVQYFAQAVELAAQCENVYVDTSSYFVTPAKLRRLCQAVGAHKLLFGSDVPVMSQSPAEGLRKIADLSLGDADKRRILGENMEALIGGGGGW